MVFNTSPPLRLVKHRYRDVPLNDHRLLLPTFVTFLCGGSPSCGTEEWPDYKSLQIHAAKRRWAFSTREYAWLRKHGIGASAVVEAMIDFLFIYRKAQLESAFPCEMNSADVTLSSCDLFDRFSSLITLKKLRPRDFYRDMTWSEVPLLLLSRNSGNIETSFCHEERFVEELVTMIVARVGKSVTIGRHRIDSDYVLQAGEKHLNRTRHEMTNHIKSLWLSIPECVWLACVSKTPIGASIVIPLTDSAYERIRAGDMADNDISDVTDIQLPSRSLLILGSGPLGWDRPPRSPFRYSLQCIISLFHHVAVLIQGLPASAEPIRILGYGGTEKTSHTLARFGFSPIGTSLKGFNSQLFEIVLPAPENDELKAKSATSFLAGMLGVCLKRINACNLCNQASGLAYLQTLSYQ